MKFILIACVTIFNLSVLSQENWKLEYSKDGMNIYTRKEVGDAMKQYKGVITINATVEECTQVLLHPSNFTQFMYNVTYAELLERPSKDQFAVYTVVHFPWPYTDRDVTLQYHLYDMGQGNVKAKLYSIPDRKNNPKYEHLGGIIGSWYFEKIDEHTTRVTHESKSSETGFPAWLVNMFLLDAPKYTLSNFKIVVEKH